MNEYCKLASNLFMEGKIKWFPQKARILDYFLLNKRTHNDHGKAQ